MKSHGPGEGPPDPGEGEDAGEEAPLWQRALAWKGTHLLAVFVAGLTLYTHLAAPLWARYAALALPWSMWALGVAYLHERRRLGKEELGLRRLVL